MEYDRIKEIEKDFFDLQLEIHKSLLHCNKNKYKLYLVAAEELNLEYKQLTGRPFLTPLQMVELYAKNWK